MELVACECGGGLANGPPPQVEADGLYGEPKEWPPGPSSSCRLLRALEELNTCRTVESRRRKSHTDEKRLIVADYERERTGSTDLSRACKRTALGCDLGWGRRRADR